MLNHGDVDSIDPGITYTTAGYQVVYATQRPMVNVHPDDPQRAVPDLAERLPSVSADGKTVKVRIRSGIHFSPPVDREVTSADVKYAIERGFFNTVNNGYAGTYFGDLVGAEVGVEPGTAISGIETPDARTVVFRLSRSTGGTLAAALTLPISAPVPREYAAPFDRRKQSAYGMHQVATGPYMVANDAQGSTVGYKPGRRIRLVRNPSWNANTDYKPAYVDEIMIDEGHDATVASRKVLAGSHRVSGDFPVPAPELAAALEDRRDQLTLVPSGQLDSIPLNTAIPPFDDLNVRRAVVAAVDREAIRRVGGGEIRGPLASHFLPPTLPGFDEAGGIKGPGFDFLAHPRGDPQVAAGYLRKAGFRSGRYDGDDRVLLVALKAPGNERVAEIVRQRLSEMGFDVTFRVVAPDAFFTKFCGVPRARVNVCVGWGWLPDFADGQTIFGPAFHGASILPVNNANASQLDVTEINQAIARAETLTDLRERATAWAAVDRLVTEQAPAILGTWSNQPIVRSADVAGVASSKVNGWDFTFTALR